MNTHMVKVLSLLLVASSHISVHAKAQSRKNNTKKEAAAESKGLSIPFFKKNTTTVDSLEYEVPTTAAINVTNIRGNITVKTWQKKTADKQYALILIDAEKKGSQESVDATKIVIKQSKSEGLTITTTTPADIRPCSVDITLLVHDTNPLTLATDKGEIYVYNSKEKIIARTNNGQISLGNVSGAIETFTKNGLISINVNTVLPETKIFAYSEKGKIKCSLPRSTDANLIAETKRGKIVSTASVTRKAQGMPINSQTLASLQREVNGTLGKGGTATIKLHASGDIEVNEL